MPSTTGNQNSTLPNIISCNPPTTQVTSITAMSTTTLPRVDLSTPMKTHGTSFAEMIKTISTQESSIRFSQFDSSVAFDLGSKIRQLFFEGYPDAEKKGLGLVIRIELFSGLRMFECVVGNGPITAPANLCVLAQSSSFSCQGK